MQIVLVTSGSKEWHEWRKSGIGASDIGAICSVCPYRSPLDVYNDKKGLSKDRRNSAMQRGIDFEAEARQVFERSHNGLQWKPINIEKDIIFKASLDGYNAFSNTILEIKVPNRKVLDMARYGQLPIHYAFQVQWQLFVSGCLKGFFFVYNPDTLESYTVEVFPDQAIWDVMIPKACDFWQMVQNGLPPPVKKSKPADANVAALLKEMLDCKEKEKEATEKYKSLLELLMVIEGVEDGIESDSASLSVSERSGYDYKRAAEDAGVNLENYKKPVTKVWTIRAKIGS